MSEFRVFLGSSTPHDVVKWPDAPPWRRFDGSVVDRQLLPETRGGTFRVRNELIDLVNAAIHLRRPLLVTGKPGTGKSSLAYAIAHELKLGKLLVWPINSRSTLQQGLYSYEAISRLQEAAVAERTGVAPPTDIGKFIRLGPLGTALLPAARPRVLLIDEIDKSDVDLPNDLLHVFEEGVFEIPELTRVLEPVVKVRTVAGDGDDAIPIEHGKIRCREFPIVILTSNGEREFPGAFKRRCVRITMPDPTPDDLEEIVKAHFGTEQKVLDAATPLIAAFVAKRGEGDVATDQLLNVIRLAMGGADLGEGGTLAEALLRPLGA